MFFFTSFAATLDSLEKTERSESKFTQNQGLFCDQESIFVHAQKNDCHNAHGLNILSEKYCSKFLLYSLKYLYKGVIVPLRF